MKFGIYNSIADSPRGEQLDRRIDEVIAEAKLAEGVGFDSCFFGEHHQDRDGFLLLPLIVATAVATQTTTLNVGTSVILLPLYNPVHLAQDVITLDLVSKGRIILGVGLGYQEADFRAFEVPVRQRVGRFEEGVEIIRHCWTGNPSPTTGSTTDWRICTSRPVQSLPTARSAPVDRGQHPSGAHRADAHVRRVRGRTQHRHSVEHWYARSRAVQRRVTGEDIGQVPSRRAVSSGTKPTLTIGQVARCSAWPGCPTAASLVTALSGPSRSIDCDLPAAPS